MNEQEKKKNNLSRLLGIPDNVEVAHTFNPLDKRILEFSWNSPNDKKSNLISFLLDWKPYTIKMEDNH